MVISLVLYLQSDQLDNTIKAFSLTQVLLGGAYQTHRKFSMLPAIRSVESSLGSTPISSIPDRV